MMAEAPDMYEDVASDPIFTTDADVDAVLAQSAAEQSVTPAPAAETAQVAAQEPAQDDSLDEVALDPRFAKMREQEMKLQKMREEIAEREKSAKELEERFGKAKGLHAKLKALGYEKIEDLLEDYARTGGEPDPREERLSETDRKLNELLKRDQERERQAQEHAQKQALQNTLTSITDHIKKTPELELLQEPGADQAVWQVMVQHYQATQKWPSIQAAAKHVNKAYLEQAQRLAKYATVQKLVTQTASTKSPTPASAASQPPARIKTITNDVRGGATPERDLTEDELFADVTARLNKAMQQDRLNRR
jgi:DNA repair exonuclease SbcCD ATPase subunit